MIIINKNELGKQFSYRSGKWTVDPLIFVRHLVEKYKKKSYI
jgi:hypothetical protein